jgi:predicted MFS family arabinose efflux permease
MVPGIYGRSVVAMIVVAAFGVSWKFFIVIVSCPIPPKSRSLVAESIRIKCSCVGVSISLYAHSLGLGGSAVGDLLDAELVKLGLQLLELLGELLLVLSPELTSLDLGRLET